MYAMHHSTFKLSSLTGSEELKLTFMQNFAILAILSLSSLFSALYLTF